MADVEEAQIIVDDIGNTGGNVTTQVPIDANSVEEAQIIVDDIGNTNVTTQVQIDANSVKEAQIIVQDIDDYNDDLEQADCNTNNGDNGGDAATHVQIDANSVKEAQIIVQDIDDDNDDLEQADCNTNNGANGGDAATHIQIDANSVKEAQIIVEDINDDDNDSGEGGSGSGSGINRDESIPTVGSISSGSTTTPIDAKGNQIATIAGNQTVTLQQYMRLVESNRQENAQKDKMLASSLACLQKLADQQGKFQESFTAGVSAAVTAGVQAIVPAIVPGIQASIQASIQAAASGNNRSGCGNNNSSGIGNNRSNFGNKRSYKRSRKDNMSPAELKDYNRNRMIQKFDRDDLVDKICNSGITDDSGYDFTNFDGYKDGIKWTKRDMVDLLMNNNIN
jgi:hypothetical protein